MYPKTPNRVHIRWVRQSWETLDVGENVGEMSKMELTERQQNILKLIKDSPTISAKQMSEILSVTQRTIERDIATLRDKKKKITREGSDKDGKWIIL